MVGGLERLVSLPGDTCRKVSLLKTRRLNIKKILYQSVKRLLISMIIIDMLLENLIKNLLEDCITF